VSKILQTEEKGIEVTNLKGIKKRKKNPYFLKRGLLQRQKT
jgi:hypothetical protein